MKKLLTGDEAVARGAWEAGVRYAAAYPGTPSTEILENLSTYPELTAEWACNEKVALESVIGASIAGGRAIASMKHVGLNVAADPLFTFSYTGVGAGTVIVTADEPGQFSSQNEQDNRYYALSQTTYAGTFRQQRMPKYDERGLRPLGKIRRPGAASDDNPSLSQQIHCRSRLPTGDPCTRIRASSG